MEANNVPIPPSFRPAGVLLAAGASLALFVAIAHPKVQHTAGDIATIPIMDWWTIHFVSSIGFSLMAIASLLYLQDARARPFARIGYACLVVSGVSMIVANGLDGAGSSHVAQDAAAGVNVATFDAFMQTTKHVILFAFGLATVGGISLIRSRLSAPLPDVDAVFAVRAERAAQVEAGCVHAIVA